MSKALIINGYKAHQGIQLNKQKYWKELKTKKLFHNSKGTQDYMIYLMSPKNIIVYDFDEPRNKDGT